MLPLVRGGNEITEEGRSLSAKIKGFVGGILGGGREDTRKMSKVFL